MDYELLQMARQHNEAFLDNKANGQLVWTGFTKTAHLGWFFVLKKICSWIDGNAFRYLL